MIRKTLTLAALAVALAFGTADAANFDTLFYPLKQKVADLGTCTTKLKGNFRIVIDGASASDCTTGASSSTVPCYCNGSAWVAGGTGNASTATVADAGGDTTTFVGLFGSATGSLAPLTDAGISYNATTNALTVSGGLVGNASTVTVADAGGDSTTFLALATAATGSLAPATDAGAAYDATANRLDVTGVVSGGGGVGILRAATLPTCDATLAPTGIAVLAYDTTGPDLCVCNGSAWAPVDGSGTCA